MNEHTALRKVLWVMTAIAAITAILGIVKLTSEALSLGTHKYFRVDND